VLSDYKTAPIDEKLRATLGFLQKLCVDPENVGADDAQLVLATGVSPRALEDAVWVCTNFSIFTRVADGLGFDMLDDKGWANVANILWNKGYL
jgi:hypothetical protein